MVILGNCNWLLPDWAHFTLEEIISRVIGYDFCMLNGLIQLHYGWSLRYSFIDIFKTDDFIFVQISFQTLSKCWWFCNRWGRTWLITCNISIYILISHLLFGFGSISILIIWYCKVGLCPSVIKPFIVKALDFLCFCWLISNEAPRFDWCFFVSIRNKWDRLFIYFLVKFWTIIVL